MQFSLIPQEEGKFTFQVQDDTSLPILDSPVFFNRESCIASIRGFIDQIRNPEAIDFGGTDGAFHFILKDEAGEIWMKSLNFEKRENLEAILHQLREKASDNTSFEVNMRRQRDQSLPSLPKEINYQDLYDFTLVSRSKKLGFHTLQSKKNKKFYFLFNDDSGVPILYSRSFSTPAQRDRRIRAIIKQSEKRNKYELFQQGGSTYFILKGSNGKEIARSATFPDKDSAETALQLIQKKAIAFAKKFPEPPKAPKKVVNQYRLDQASTSGATGFDPFQSEDKLHYFHFNDKEAKPVLFSEGYTSSRSRDNGIKSLIRNAGLQNRYQIKEDEAQAYFILKAGNRQEIARSKGFESLEALQEAIDWVRIQIPRYAAQYGVSLDTDSMNENFVIEVGLNDEEEEVLIPLDPKPKEKEESKESSSPQKSQRSTPSEFSILWQRVWPWLLLAIALFLLYLLLRNCSAENSGVPNSKAKAKTESVIAQAPVLEAEDAAKSNELISAEKENSSGTISSSTLSKSDLEKESSELADPTTARLENSKPITSSFNFPAGSMLMKMEAFLSGTATGKSPIYAMDHARFPYNSPKLNKEAEKELDDLVKLLNKYPRAKVGIFGHIDLNEEDFYSGPFAEEFLTLSDIRARCIYRKLIERGISEARLSFEGLANNKPIEDKVNPINRRLELVLEK